MKFYAVFKAVTEKHVLLDAENWQEAAQIANAMKVPVVQAETLLEVVGMCHCPVPDCECDYYVAVHELVGPCNKCGFQILERSCSDLCVHQHSPRDDEYKRGGGFVMTEHGHVVWCSQACRDVDRINDPEVIMAPLEKLAYCSASKDQHVD